jgi:hypothetical protein
MRFHPWLQRLVRVGNRMMAGVLIVFAVVAGFGLVRGADEAALGKSGMPVYPLKVSRNKRYLVDQKGTPFLIAGESPQALMVNLSEDKADAFFANRRGHGFNTVWINLLCKPYTGGRPEGSTYDGILPFTTPDDLATPNPGLFRPLRPHDPPGREARAAGDA